MFKGLFLFTFISFYSWFKSYIYICFQGSECADKDRTGTDRTGPRQTKKTSGKTFEHFCNNLFNAYKTLVSLLTYHFITFCFFRKVSLEAKSKGFENKIIDFKDYDYIYHIVLQKLFMKIEIRSTKEVFILYIFIVFI